MATNAWLRLWGPGHCAGNFLRHFPYNKVTDESPPTGAAKHRMPGYNDN
jgi:hypothetical protein